MVVMDALGLAYRSYYALARWGTDAKGQKHAFPALTNSRKEPTNAIYGMANLFLKFRRELKPDLWALAWDGPGPTFRHELYKAYKEHRPEMPEELSAQLTPIEDLARCVRSKHLDVGRVQGFAIIRRTVADQGAVSGLCVHALEITRNEAAFCCILPAITQISLARGA